MTFSVVAQWRGMTQARQRLLWTKTRYSLPAFCSAPGSTAYTTMSYGHFGRSRIPLRQRGRDRQPLFTASAVRALPGRDVLLRNGGLLLRFLGGRKPHPCRWSQPDRANGGFSMQFFPLSETRGARCHQHLAAQVDAHRRAEDRDDRGNHSQSLPVGLWP